MKLAAFLSAAALSVLTLSAAQAGPTLDRIKSNKAISIGYRDASIPFSYLGADQKPIGFSLDLCSKLVTRLEADLGEKIAVNLVPVNSSNRIPLIQNGTIDIECGGTSSSKKRLEQVSFSVSTFASQPSWLTMADSGITSAADLKGKTVVVTQGSNAVGIAQGISQKEGLGLSIVQAKDHAESFLMLTSGRAAAFMEDDILLAGLKAQYKDPAKLAFLSDQYPKTYYGLMFSKDDPEFKATVDDVLGKLMASGEFTKLYDKWFVSPIPPKGMNLNFPMSEALKERVAKPSDVVDY
ncbi:amino acid ABC transporter substrate-binding protein [Ancylobacter mangrovi]|uniref:amino acid ABC transporter substrate-binding protein n=1 Tax=Ancylobacter mangrovi TaxID=2972472 RepID=UPI00216129FA|nr:amino acid ABC transporter substrate-binding protein [Ancylobacter mangrovi]MCS0503302.1 amino acid ABC transporter substrate-binding protein [Ancylobacter mangrovi]